MALLSPSFTCTPGLNLTIAGASAVQPILRGWASLYVDECPGSTIQFSSDLDSHIGNNDLGPTVLSSEGAAFICDMDVNATGEDLAMMARLPQIGELYSLHTVYIPGSLFEYECYNSFLPTRFVEVGRQALVLATPSELTTETSVAKDCIEKIRGAMDTDLLTVIISNLTETLLDEYFGAIPVDGDDSTRRWSEINSTCADDEIELVGLADNRDSLGVLVDILWADRTDEISAGVSLEPDRVRLFNTTDEMHDYLLNATAAIGFLDYLVYEQEQHNGPVARWDVIPVTSRNVRNVPIFPTRETIQAVRYTYPLGRSLATLIAEDDSDRLAPLFEVGMSDAGTTTVDDLGYISLSLSNRIAMLSRMDANGGTSDIMNLTCATGRLPSISTTSIHALLTETFSAVYTTACPPDTTIVVEPHTNGTERLCSFDGETSLSNGSNLTIATVTSRKLDPSEATKLRKGFRFRCTETRQRLAQIEFALDALVFATTNNGTAHDCIDTLGGSLTLDQLRWMFSSLSTDELIMTGWDSSSIPNTDGDDGTFLWSELDKTCKAEEIVLGFYHRSEGEEDGMGTAQDELMEFFASTVFVEANETFRADSSLLLVSSDTLQALPAMVVATTFSVVTREALPWSLVGIKNETNGTAIQPTTSTIQSRTYSPFLLPVYLNFLSEVISFRFDNFVSTFLLTLNGRRVAQTLGYVPLSESDEAAMQERAVATRSFRFCFSSNNSVEVRGKGTIPVSEVRIGDYVRSSIDGRFDRVYTFGHRSDHAVATFHRISLMLEDGAKNKAKDTPTLMELTGDHLVSRADGSFVAAGKVEIGDLLLDENGNELVVHQIELVQSRGLYAPFTESGTIVVNGCVASVYANIQHHPGLDTGKDLVVVGGIGTVPTHTMAYLTQAPHRIFCHLWLDICKEEQYTEDGMSVWSAWQLNAFDSLFGAGMPNAMQWLVAIPVGLFVLTFAIIEVLFFGSSVVWMVTAIVGLVAIFVGMKMSVSVESKSKTTSTGME